MTYTEYTLLVALLIITIIVYKVSRAVRLNEEANQINLSNIEVAKIKASDLDVAMAEQHQKIWNTLRKKQKMLCLDEMHKMYVEETGKNIPRRLFPTYVYQSMKKGETFSQLLNR